MIQKLTGQSLVQRETSPPVHVRGSADRELFLSTLVKNPRWPSPPALALKIVELVSDPNATVQQIAELLTTDPVLCGKLLKTANSVLFSPSQPITSINQTIGVLGFNRLRSLVLSLSLPVMQAKLSIDPGLRRMWKNSVVGAVIARELAMHCKLPQPEDELITGLLRDLGMFLLQQSSPQVYEPVWNGAIHRTGEAQTVFEIETFGVSHAEASAALLKHWRLPPSFQGPGRANERRRRCQAVCSTPQRLNAYHGQAAAMRNISRRVFSNDDRSPMSCRKNVPICGINSMARSIERLAPFE